MNQRLLALASAALPSIAVAMFLFAAPATARATDGCVENCDEDQGCPIFCYYDELRYSPGACLTTGCDSPYKQTCKNNGTWSSCDSNCLGGSCPPQGGT